MREVWSTLGEGVQMECLLKAPESGESTGVELGVPQADRHSG